MKVQAAGRPVAFLYPGIMMINTVSVITSMIVLLQLLWCGMWSI